MTKKCKHCQAEIDEKATKCPHCQSDLRSWFQKHKILTGILALFVIGWIPSIFTSVPTSSPTKSSDSIVRSAPKPTRRMDFRAIVKFTGTQFEITNADDTDCERAKLEINSKYTLEGYTLKSGETYKVGALQFAKSDGTRFQPFEIKPKDFYIYCSGSNALGGAAWLGNFE